jgi:2,4-dienoyl-CoA reductase-like NADH-dependent reductase (Old Yellow Enzyme family)
MAMFGAALERANDAGLGYVHVVGGETGGSRALPLDAVALVRTKFHGAYMANNGYNRELAIEAVETGAADLIAFGRLFLANPCAPCEERADQRARPRHLLWRRREGLYRLPDARTACRLRRLSAISPPQIRRGIPAAMVEQGRHPHANSDDA